MHVISMVYYSIPHKYHLVVNKIQGYDLIIFNSPVTEFHMHWVIFRLKGLNNLVVKCVNSSDS